MLNFEEGNIYFLLVDVCQEFGVFPSASVESENYFRQLLLNYEGEAEIFSSISAWLRQQLMTEFVAIESRPRWIQNPEWPIVGGKPLTFVGQLDVNGAESRGLFHDDTAIYVFIGADVPPVTVIQQF